ncbi:NAD(P)H-binding protein [Sphingomonas sp. CL5.1]|uniref:NAD-dependent epimerase/dehydratase family protein n=1 Tax=Sphingomonas sp. CL5.1 TaxID=2653203 RepID=UPI00158365EC|nr:NAD-dependent epimerase/dehydratase family protein [Sphingomonas sp. CL5.1]QKS00196.1 NAD(P)H-binding protein [Sphingomonas sp. CL5.1]
MILALTGATGFVGGHVVRRALEAGHQVRALARRPQPARDGVSWIAGALDDPAALAELTAGADAVIHIAGVVNAPDRAGFAAGNVDGTRAIVAATAPGTRFVHVSSLSAREPQLSIYGWSKREAEEVVAASALAWDMVRPPGIYGPGDMEMLDVFRFARRGFSITPPAGRASWIHVDDLARLLVVLAETPAGRAIYEMDDGREGGWTHHAFAEAVGVALGRAVRPIALTPGLLRLGARVDRLIRGKRARLTADRVAYFCHPDWTVDPAKRPPAALWAPAIASDTGLRETVESYRAAGLL